MNRFKETWDFEEWCDDILSAYIESFTEEQGLARPLHEDDYELYPEETEVIFTGKGMKLYDRQVKRLSAIGNKLFPGKELEIKASYLIEP